MLAFKLVRILALATATLGIAPVASAVTFDGPGDHVLSSTNLGFTSATLGAGMVCTTLDFTVVVAANGATANVTAATFDGCTGAGFLAGTTVHWAATGFPWPITDLGVPGQFRIDGIHITQNITGVGHITLEGNLNGAIDCGSTRVVTFENSTGLTETSALGNGPALVTSTFGDNRNTLCVT